ncbi:hypothetical protein EDD11_000215 [Mortierella claussenii]|nr:hypothetical protein EDD11_000215 [Mortierella claussenii]
MATRRAGLVFQQSTPCVQASEPSTPGTATNLNEPLFTRAVVAAGAPAPPPKPKRISLAPLPKAKPLSLQSVPLQSKIEAPARSITLPTPMSTPTTAAIAPTGVTTTSIPPLTPTKTPAFMRSQDPVRSKPSFSSSSVPASTSTTATTTQTLPFSSIPPVKKPRSMESSVDSSSVLSDPALVQQQQRLKNHGRIQPSSPPPTMSMSHPNIGSKPTTPDTASATAGAVGTNAKLIGARSRLRSTSDAKASTSLAVAVSQTSGDTARNISSNEQQQQQQVEKDGFGFIENKGYTSPLVSPTTYHSSTTSYFRSNGGYGDDPEDGGASAAASAAAAEKLATSLHKIQALAHEQTERMKQINYAEKRADLAEAVYEKSSLWRARGAEWSGIAKKAWEDRGGMGGIAGGLADRWKRRTDGVNDGTPDYSRPRPASHIFGLPLEDAVRLSKISASTGVPAIVTRCIEYLDIMGVEEVGLYRVSGSTSNVARLKAMFDNGHDYDFLQKGNEPQNPHDVATVLKLYLRELPSPIISAEIMPVFNNIDFSDPDPNQQQSPLQRLKEALCLLPLENYILLGTLSQHLSNLADYESCTKMNISNLGLIFCPTLQIGSVLFKYLLGGDGGEEERRKNLLSVWEDLERRHEEMENLEMIKDFKMGLQIEQNGGYQGFDLGSNDQNERKMGGERDQENIDCGARQSWEQLDDRDQGGYSSLLSPPQQRASTISSTSGLSPHSKGNSNSSGTKIDGAGNVFSVAPPIANTHDQLHSEFGSSAVTTPPPKRSETPLDLYDELMARELNEATNTPLIDLEWTDNELDVLHRQSQHQLQASQDGQWRRHAREPATKSSSPLPFGVTRHQRLPAVSIRY